MICVLKKKRFKNLSINIKTFLIVSLLVSSLILTSNMAIYYMFKRVLRNQIMDDLNNVMIQNSSSMDTLVNSINQASLYLCSDRVIANTLTQKFDDAITIPLTMENLRNDYNALIAIPLNDVLMYYHSNFFVMKDLPNAKYLNSEYTLDGNSVFSASNVTSEDWYKKAYNLHGSIYTFIRDENKNKIYMARSVSNPYLIGSASPNGFMGIEVFSLNISDIGEKIRTAELTSSTKVFLTDSDGTILYSNSSNDLQKQITQYIPQSLVKDYVNSTTTSMNYNGRKYIASINSLKYGWNLIALIPEDDISARMSSVSNIIFLTCILALMIGIVLSILFSRSITGPIEKLASTMKNVRSKEYFDITVEPPSGDEVGTLYESFNTMMNRINSLVDEVIKSSKLQREAEMKALQAQINPHFLYNTLDSLCWLALCNGEKKIAGMTSSLASIMRFNIKDPEKLVTISEELKNVSNYINIQKERYAGHFDITYRIPRDILYKGTPKLTLQPLVENAIVHGTETTDRKGQILISGYVEQGKIILSISDNGGGTNVDELNAYLNNEQGSLHHSDGFGIKNVNQRIKTYFGDTYGLHYCANQPFGTTAIVSLPYHQNKYTRNKNLRFYRPPTL